MTDSAIAEDAEPVSAANLNDAFQDEGEEQEEVGAKPAKTPEPEQESKGDKSKESDEDDEDAEPPAAEEEDEVKSVPVAALKDERKKRQAAEAELTELKKKQTPEPTESEREAQYKVFAQKTELSRDMLMEEHADYEAMETIFTEIAKADPALIDKMVASKNPAKFAYDTAKNSDKGKEYAEFQEFKRLKAAEAAKKPVDETPADKRKKLIVSVPNINKAASIGSNSNPKEAVGSLDDMFEDD